MTILLAINSYDSVRKLAEIAHVTDRAWAKVPPRNEWKPTLVQSDAFPNANWLENWDGVIPIYVQLSSTVNVTLDGTIPVNVNGSSI